MCNLYLKVRSICVTHSVGGECMTYGIPVLQNKHHMSCVTHYDGGECMTYLYMAHAEGKHQFINQSD
jgi:hypothetical protein